MLVCAVPSLAASSRSSVQFDAQALKLNLVSFIIDRDLWCSHATRNDVVGIKILHIVCYRSVIGVWVMTEGSVEHERGACGSKQCSLKAVHLKFTLWVKW